MWKQAADRRGTSPPERCMSAALTVFNVVFWLTGLTLVTVGAISLRLWSPRGHTYVQLMPAHYRAVPVSYLLVGGGGAVMLFATVGAWCTARHNRNLLYFYSGFLAAVLALEVLAGALGVLCRDHAHAALEERLWRAMDAYGGAGAHASAQSTALDDLQARLHCCGVRLFSDWANSSWAQQQQQQRHLRHTTRPYPFLVPRSCCKSGARQCPTAVFRSNIDLIHLTGCYSKIRNFIHDNAATIADVGIGLAFFQVVGVVLAYMLARQLTLARYQPVSGDADSSSQEK